jgi:Spy/CpxP family protein refolding chaperone
MSFMLGKLPWALLAGSVAFNFAVLLHASGGSQPPAATSQPASSVEPRSSQPGEDGVLGFEHRLALDDQQKQLFDKLRNETRAKAKDIRQSLAAARKELLDLMANDSTDPAKVDELIKQDAELGRQLRVLALEHTTRLMRMLSPQQRQKLLEILRKRELAPMHGFGPNTGPTSRPFGQGPTSRPADGDKLHHWQERQRARDSHTDSPTRGPSDSAPPQTQPAQGT